MLKKVLEIYKEIATLSEVSALLGWDMNVNLPAQAGEGRADQSALLTKIITEKWLSISTDNLVGKNLEERAMIRNLKQGTKFYHNVPKEVIVKFDETSSKAYMAWVEARKCDDFKIFLPHLEKMVEQNRIVAGYYGFNENPYDALLDMHEVGLTTKTVKEVFDNLTPELTKIIKKLKSKSKETKDLGTFSALKQKEISEFVIQKMGYDLGSGRMDISPHPFTTELGSEDVRITNRYNEGDFKESIMVAMHEAGHALYEQGVNKKYARTPLAGGVSLGIHESQSRFWENQVGRSFEFAKFITPTLQSYFPELTKFTADDVYKMFNTVNPSLIRTESDEVTYNLHIALRFELEEALINKKIKVKDLPRLWNEKMKKYLGITPPSDKDGVLQDVHWSHGPMGYFPTYTLGNLISSQIANKLKKQLKLSELTEKGELLPIRNWLKVSLHQYGSLYMPDELIKKVTGEPLNHKYFVDYIKSKYSKIYKVKL